MMTSHDSGASTYMPLRIGGSTFLNFQYPVYQGGIVPTTVTGRRPAFLGWVGAGVRPQLVLNSALLGHPNTAVTLKFRSGSSSVKFVSSRRISGRRPVGDDRSAQRLDGNDLRCRLSRRSASKMARALALLVAGAALSLLLAALVFVLGTGRSRALCASVQRATGELRYQALHDALTGLPEPGVDHGPHRAAPGPSRRHGTAGAALFVDLDEFKNVNDTLGHDAGDQLLVAVAERLASTLREADTIGRMGGDEFVVLIDGGVARGAPELVAERLLDVMREPFELDGAPTPMMVNTSIGIAVGDRATAGELLRDADMALYQAKAAGKNRYEIFHPEHAGRHQPPHRAGVRSALRARRRAVPPRLPADLQPRRPDLVGVEALLRWQHPTDGLVQPDEFIPILEQTGQIREVGRWVLHKACEQMAAWHARGDTLDVSVNVSGRQLDDDAIVDHIRDALDASGLDPRAR